MSRDETVEREVEEGDGEYTEKLKEEKLKDFFSFIISRLGKYSVFEKTSTFTTTLFVHNNYMYSVRGQLLGVIILGQTDSCEIVLLWEGDY